MTVLPFCIRGGKWKGKKERGEKLQEIQNEPVAKVFYKSKSLKIYSLFCHFLNLLSTKIVGTHSSLSSKFDAIEFTNFSFLLRDKNYPHIILWTKLSFQSVQYSKQPNPKSVQSIC